MRVKPAIEGKKVCCGSGSLWICIILRSRIQIRIKAKSRIRIRIRVNSWVRIRINIKIQELWRLKKEPWRAMYAHNKAVEIQMKRGGYAGQ
jgi:hypothetical protein